MGWIVGDIAIEVEGKSDETLSVLVVQFLAGRFGRAATAPPQRAAYVSERHIRMARCPQSRRAEEVLTAVRRCRRASNH